jgi:hypothetical protein
LWTNKGRKKEDHALNLKHFDRYGFKPMQMGDPYNTLQVSFEQIMGMKTLALVTPKVLTRKLLINMIVVHVDLLS